MSVLFTASIVFKEGLDDGNVRTSFDTVAKMMQFRALPLAGPQSGHEADPKNSGVHADIHEEFPLFGIMANPDIR